MALAGIYLTFCTFIIDQGFGTALVQRTDLEHEHLDAAFWVQLAIGVAIAGITVGAAGWIATFFAEPRLTEVLQVLALFPAITAFTLVQQAQLKRQFEFRALAIRHIISAVAGAIIGIALAVLGYGVWSLVAQMLGGAVVGLVVLWRASSWRPRFAFSMRHFRDLVGFGTSVFTP